MSDKPHTSMGLRRGIALLKIMARSPEGCGFRDLQQHMDGLPAATLSRILKVMIEEELIIKDPETGQYRAGELAFSLSRLFMGRATPAERVQPVLDELAQETGHSAAFACLEHDGFSYQAVAEVGESFHYMPVGRLNANTITNGFGLTCLAFAPEETQERFMRVRHELIEKRDGTDAYRKQLQEVRRTAAYVDISQGRMTRFVAAVFCGTDGTPGGAVGVTVPGTVTDAAEQQSYLEMVKQAAARATAALA